jgi:hypothetical protein
VRRSDRRKPSVSYRTREDLRGCTPSRRAAPHTFCLEDEDVTMSADFSTKVEPAPIPAAASQFMVPMRPPVPRGAGDQRSTTITPAAHGSIACHIPRSPRVPLHRWSGAHKCCYTGDVATANHDAAAVGPRGYRAGSGSDRPLAHTTRTPVVTARSCRAPRTVHSRRSVLARGGDAVELRRVRILATPPTSARPTAGELAEDRSVPSRNALGFDPSTRRRAGDTDAARVVGGGDVSVAVVLLL